MVPKRHTTGATTLYSNFSEYVCHVDVAYVALLTVA